jgi:ATP-dependent RNA helicase RhlE
LDPTPTASNFASLGLSAPALETVRAAGYLTPTPVQERAIPPALAGRDVIACAGTGTGKTAAFLLPIVERLAGRRGTRALVLAPTRELAQQTVEHLSVFGGPRGVRGVEIVGGLDMGPQVEGLVRGHEVVVATPGRLLDHLERGTARLGQVEFLVLDEADRMLDMGFRPQISRILARLPAERQTVLCSATMGSEVEQFARSCLRDPVRIDVVPSGTVAENATQQAFVVSQTAKYDLLLRLLDEVGGSTLVFTRTKHRADRVADFVERAGHRVECIHGDRTQGQRQHALDGFRAGRCDVLVATDVASRGIDVEGIDHVVNFDMSLVPDDYVHRVGRTARAAASGLATSFCAPEELSLLHAIERFTKCRIERVPVPVGPPPAPRQRPVEPERRAGPDERRAEPVLAAGDTARPAARRNRRRGGQRAASGARRTG